MNYQNSPLPLIAVFGAMCAAALVLKFISGTRATRVRIAVYVLLATAALSVLVPWLLLSSPGEPARNAPVEQFRSYSGGHKWYWAKVEGLRAPPPGYTAADEFYSKSAQALLMSTDKSTRMIYTEMVPSRGLKAFQGPGYFEKIDGVHEPVFAQRGEKIIFIGFFKGRALRIEVSSTSRAAQARGEALRLALEVVRSNR